MSADLSVVSATCDVLQLVDRSNRIIRFVKRLRARDGELTSATAEAYYAGLGELARQVLRIVGADKNKADAALGDDAARIRSICGECHDATRDLLALVQSAPQKRRFLVLWVLRKRSDLDDLKRRLRAAQDLLGLSSVIQSCAADVHGELDPAQRFIVHQIQAGKRDLKDFALPDRLETPPKARVARQPKLADDDTTSETQASKTQPKHDIISQAPAEPKTVTTQGYRKSKKQLERESARTRNDANANANTTTTTVRAPSRIMAHFEETSRLPQTMEVSPAERQELRKSLRFADINQRRNHIAKPAEGTFEWLVPKGSETAPDPQCAEFATWLHTAGPAPVFWVMGKPGSGKSTLMKSLVSRPDRLAPETLVVSHFFWRPGNPMQNSLKGFLCSVLYQLVEADDRALDAVLQHVLGLDRKAEAEAPRPRRQSPADWTVDDLESCLRAALQPCKRPVCLFVDGVDELDPGPDGGANGDDDLDRFLRLTVGASKSAAAHVDDDDDVAAHDAASWLGSNPMVRICLSGRDDDVGGSIPSHWYSAGPSIRLHELTGDDLELYARANLHLPENHPPETREADLAALASQLRRKADGVFLWVYLAVGTLNRDLGPWDKRPAMEKRIGDLHGGLDNMYQDVWGRAPDTSRTMHQKEAARYLCLVMRAREHDWKEVDRNVHSFNLLFSTHKALCDRILAARDVDDGMVQEVLDEARALERRVLARCAGMLHLGDPSSSVHHLAEWKPRNEGEDFWNRVIELGHSTVCDFLAHAPGGKSVLGQADMTPARVSVRLAEGYLAMARVYHAVGNLCSFDMLPFLQWLRCQVGEGGGRGGGATSTIPSADAVGLLQHCKTLHDGGVFTYASKWEQPQGSPLSRRQCVLSEPDAGSVFWQAASECGLADVVTQALLRARAPRKERATYLAHVCDARLAAAARPGPARDGSLVRKLLRGGGLSPNDTEALTPRPTMHHPLVPVKPRSSWIAFLQGLTRSSWPWWRPAQVPHALSDLADFVRAGADLNADVPLILFVGSASGRRWDLDYSPSYQERCVEDYIVPRVHFSVRASVLVRRMVALLDPSAGGSGKIGENVGNKDNNTNSKGAKIDRTATKDAESVMTAVTAYERRSSTQTGAVRIQAMLDVSPEVMCVARHWTRREVSARDLDAIADKMARALDETDESQTQARAAAAMCERVFDTGRLSEHVAVADERDGSERHVWRDVQEGAEGRISQGLAAAWRALVVGVQHSGRDSGIEGLAE